MLQMVSGEALHILKEVSLTLTLGWCPLEIWVFFTNITNEFILGLDILRTYDACGRQTMRLAETEVSLWSPEAVSRPSSLVEGSDQAIPAQCEGVLMG
jgi:hypothetical protein